MKSARYTVLHWTRKQLSLLTNKNSRPVGRGGATGALAPLPPPYRRQRSTFFINQRLKTKWSRSIVLFLFTDCVVKSRKRGHRRDSPSPQNVKSSHYGSWKRLLAFVKYKKGIWCAYKTFFHCSIKFPLGFVCHRFLQSVESELLF